MAELTEIEAHAKIEDASFPLHTADDKDFAIVPDGYALHDLEKYRGAPRRVRAKPTLLTEESFVDYVRQFSGGGSRIYANINGKPAQFVAVLDDNAGACAPAFREHVATYRVEHSRQWDIWCAYDGKQMPQEKFAEFMEDNNSDVFDDNGNLPSQAMMRDVSRDLQAKTHVTFDSRVKLDDGSHVFAYAETISGTVKNGQLQVPERFAIAIPIFKGGSLYVLHARLRYRVTKDGLTMGYALIEADNLSDKILAEMMARIASSTQVMTVAGAVG